MATGIMLLPSLFSMDVSSPENFRKLENYKSPISVLNVQSEISFETSFYKGLSEKDFAEDRRFFCPRTSRQKP